MNKSYRSQVGHGGGDDPEYCGTCPYRGPRGPHAGRVEGLEVGGLTHTWNDWVEPARKGNFYAAFEATRHQG